VAVIMLLLLLISLLVTCLVGVCRTKEKGACQ
jgi:hypothetical protein